MVNSSSSKHSISNIVPLPDSCCLQIYATLLETTFHQNVDLDNFELEILMDITLNTLNFFRNCFLRSKGELMFVEILDRMQEQDVNEYSCNCYKKLSNAIIILLHLCLKHRFANEKCKKTLLNLFGIFHELCEASANILKSS